MDSKIKQFLEQTLSWKEEMTSLHEIVTQNPELQQGFKWMHPCYTFQGKNVVLIHGFKEYVALLFHKGALLKDTEKRLIQQTKNVQAARQLRFTNIEQILEQKELITAYIDEAVELEKSGRKIAFKTVSDYPVPDEFKEVLQADKNVKKAFENLSPGRQKAYLFHFSQAKQCTTRKARIERYLPKILNGEGMDD